MRSSHFPVNILAIALLVALPAASFAGDAASEVYRFAKGLYARQQWEAAAEEFENFLRQEPDHPEAGQAEFYLGEALVQLHRYEQASRRFAHCLAVQPDGSFRKQSLFRIGECEFLAGQPNAEPRLAAFSEAYPDDRLNGLVLNYRGQEALRHGDANRAETFFRQALDRFHDSPFQDECRLGLARSLESLGRAEEAGRYYLALAAKPNSPATIEAKYRLGALQYAEHQYATALDTFSDFADLDASNPWAASAALGRGWALMKLDRHPEAAGAFQQLRDHPLVAVQARYWLGLCRKAQEDWPGAAQALRDAAKRFQRESAEVTGARSADNVTETAIFFHAGDAELAANNLQTAQHHFEQAISAGRQGDPWLDEARRALVQTSLRRDDLIRARQDAEHFLTEWPESSAAPDLLRLLARIQLEQKDFAGAECSLCRLDDATYGKPDTPDDAYLLALSYQGQGRFEKALETLQPVLADATGDLAADARLVEASLLTALKRYDEALQTLMSHCSESDSGQVLALSAICHARLGNREQALKAYREAAGAGPDTARLRCDAAEQIAQASLDAEEFDRAETLYREILGQADDSQRKDRALVGLAWAQRGQNNLAAAEATLAQVVDHEADEAVLAEAWFLRGRVLQELGKSEPACQAFQRVVDEHPRSAYEPESLWNVAQLQERLGRRDEAVACYQKILDRGPTADHRAGALYYLAWIRRQEGQPEEADSHFREIVAAHRDSPYWVHASLSVAQHDLDVGEGDEARWTIDEVLKDERGQAVRDRALYLAGQIAYASCVWHEARERFEQVVAECPGSELVATSAFAAAEAAFQAKDGDTLALFERLAVQSDDLNPALRATARMRLAQLYAEASRWNEASEIAESFAERHPDFAQQYELDYVLGRCRAARALFAEAREAYGKVLRVPAAERTETAAKAQLMIAETFFHQRRYGEAYRAYMQVEVFYAFPELQGAALLQAGKCRQMQGDMAAAGRLYQQVLENYPGSRAALQAARQLERAT